MKLIYIMKEELLTHVCQSYREGHSLIEAFQLVEAGYQIITKLCFVISTFGLMVSYSFYQVKAKQSLIGGLFGIVMITAFAACMVGELVETTLAIDIETIESMTALAMAGFSCFIVARFIWLKNVILLESEA